VPVERSRSGASAEERYLSFARPCGRGDPSSRPRARRRNLECRARLARTRWPRVISDVLGEAVAFRQLSLANVGSTLAGRGASDGVIRDVTEMIIAQNDGIHDADQAAATLGPTDFRTLVRGGPPARSARLIIAFGLRSIRHGDIGLHLRSGDRGDRALPHAASRTGAVVNVASTAGPGPRLPPVTRVCRRKGRRGYSTRTITLPVLPPVNSKFNADGACSRPSTMWVTNLTLPSASQPAIAACPSAKRSR
jgi:hypothetical protein